MSRLKVFTVYDSKAEAYLHPFIMKKRGEAVRAFIESVNGSNTQLSKHPADFTLFEIGEYDEWKGEYFMYESKQNLGTGIEFLNSVEPGPTTLTRLKEMEKLEQPQ